MQGLANSGLPLSAINMCQLANRPKSASRFIVRDRPTAGELGVGDTQTARPACNGSGCRHAPGPVQFAIARHRTSNVPQVRRVDVAHSDCVGRTWLGAANV
jgi:hypothetical protein